MGFNQIEQDFKSVIRINGLRNWEPFMRKYHCDRVAELGVFRGDNFMQMIAHKPKLAVAVDTWNNDGVHSSNDGSFTRVELNDQFTYFKNRVVNLPFVQILREDTSETASNFSNNYFDLVYVDADASFEGCYSDLVAWYPKVKYGKFLVGHNYRGDFGVVKAVNRFIKEKGLKLITFSTSNWAVIKK